MLKIDMHVHTHYSMCGLMSEKAIISACKKKGLNGVAITDHNTIKGALALKKIAFPNFVVIIGEEIQTREGEITGYFIEEQIPSQLSPEETIERIKAQKGLVSIPHPFGSFRKSKIRKDVLERIIDAVDIIEVFNSRNIYIKDNQRALILAQKNRLACLVGSDAHLSCEIGKAYVEIDNFSDPQQFLQKLRSARLIANRSGAWVHLLTKCIKLLRKNHLMSVKF